MAPAIRKWLFNDAMPWWTEHGLDRQHGGYVEQFSLDGTDNGATYKRTRVTGRQIYVFSQAALLGWKDGAQAAEHGFHFLTRRCWLGEKAGFARTVTRAGDILDPTPDLYDLAFALFGFAWYLRASGDASALLWAHRTLDGIETRLRHPSGQGYRHELNSSESIQQNPHMHLIEACLATYASSKEQRFADKAVEIADLFRTKFYDPKSQTLCEIFQDDWSRASGEAGRRIEPGHQFEWAWILSSAQALIGLNFEDEIRGLIEFGERFGIGERGQVRNIVRDDGVPINSGSRSWPNAERIKAAVALYELDGVDPTHAIDTSAQHLFSNHLHHTPAGTWIDEFDENGAPLSTLIPSSSLYHVVLAFAEALRVAARLKP